MKSLSYRTCQIINDLKIGVGVETKWWWAVDSALVGKKNFYGLFTRTKDRDRYMTYFHKAYTMDNIPALLFNLWKKTVNKNVSKIPSACVEYFQELAGILAKKGWREMEKEFNAIVDSHVKNSRYGLN